ncbi:MAG: phage portal protein, partial [Bdellovibrionales bacterium]|nr:phage portal protein [Bdellovibrionales bacterium]
MSFDFRPNHIDRLIGVFNPLAMRNRMIARHQIALMTRQLDGAKSFNSSTIPRNSKSANSEVRGQLAPLRENVRDLIRNAPFAQKGLAVIVHGVVGWGIEASIRHPNPKQLQKILDLWKEWALDGGCSLDGKTDFSGLQRQVMQAVAADGEVISRDVFLINSLRLQILEADFICDRDQGIYAGANSFVNGLVMDEYGRPSH